jgi:hypothetical protein
MSTRILWAPALACAALAASSVAASPVAASPTVRSADDELAAATAVTVTPIEFGTVQAFGAKRIVAVTITNGTAGTVEWRDAVSNAPNVAMSLSDSSLGVPFSAQCGVSFLRGLAAGRSCVVFATLTPGAPGVVNATASVGGVTTSVTANVVAPSVDVVVPTLGAATVGSSVSGDVVVTNTGIGAVQLTVGTSADFTISPRTMRVEPGASDTARLTFRPTTVGRREGTLTLTAPALEIVRPITAGATNRSGYWALASDGRIYHFGDAPALSAVSTSSATTTTSDPITIGVGPGGVVVTGGSPVTTSSVVAAVKIERSARGGAWVLLSNGTVVARGGAPSFADFRVPAEEQATSISGTPTGAGFWVFTASGRVFAVGDATSFGDLTGVALNSPVLGSVATPTGGGYYMVAGDGGIFAFGDARFYGSMGGQPLNRPVTGLVPDPDGAGYWLVASDGGVFAFDAAFRGSMGAAALNAPVVDMISFGDGYLMLGNDGGVFNFSTLPFSGSLGGQAIPAPIVSVTAFIG